MSKPKRHHYVPRFYLDHFTNKEGFLWVYDRKTDEYRKQKPSDTAVQKNYYAIQNKDGGKDMGVEELFSVIEGEADAIIKKILSGKTITQEEKGKLSVYISYQMVRVPEYEKQVTESEEKLIKKINEMRFSSVEETKKVIQKYKESGNNQKEIDPEEMFNFVKSGKYGVSFPREWSLRYVLELGYDLAEYFANMEWTFLYAPNNTSFITSDNPYTTFAPEDRDPNCFWQRGVGIMTKGAKKVLPLSTNLILVIGDIGDRFFIAESDRVGVRGINKTFARTSGRFIYARDEALLRSVVKQSKVKDIPLDRERVFMS